jgi:hypothetical protein
MAVYRLTVYDRNIAGMFLPDGDVFEEAQYVTRRVESLARQFAPVGNTGHLKESHRRRIEPVGIYGVVGQVEAGAKYASFVHKGTTGPIKSIRPLDRRGRPPGKLELRGGMEPGSPGQYPYRVSVSGQESQPWLREAANAVLSQYGITLLPDN